MLDQVLEIFEITPDADLDIMQPGGITRPIRTSNSGIAIVQVQKILEGEVQPLEQVRAIIENNRDKQPPADE